MKTEKKKPRACANEGCARPAEPDGRFCEACGLESDLFRRDLRRREAGGGEARPPEARPYGTEGDRGFENASR